MINQIDVYMEYIYGVGMNEHEGGRIGGGSVFKMSINGGGWNKVIGCCVYQISVSGITHLTYLNATKSNNLVIYPRSA